MTDTDLLREFRKGNWHAFSGPVKRNSKPVTMMIQRMVKDLEEAKNIVQTVFLKAYEGIPTFLMESSFETSLHRIALNVARDDLRKREQGMFGVSVDDLPAPAESPGEQFDKARHLQKLRLAIEELPEKQHLTLLLRIYEDMDYTEIAGILGGTAGSARGNFFQATRTLKGKLGNIK
jgi:RNA polymerase sigma-70 factor (ECF subfamily)